MSLHLSLMTYLIVYCYLRHEFTTQLFGAAVTQGSASN
jgi:hypothetical protein